MKLEDHLSKEQKQQLNKMRSSPKKKQEQLSRKEWEEIMGVNRDTYIKVHGKIKRR